MPFLEFVVLGQNFCAVKEMFPQSTISCQQQDICEAHRFRLLEQAMQIMQH